VAEARQGREPQVRLTVRKPTRPVALIAPNAAGGNSDRGAREMERVLRKDLRSGREPTRFMLATPSARSRLLLT
jgi:hypothetical protein